MVVDRCCCPACPPPRRHSLFEVPTWKPSSKYCRFHINSANSDYWLMRHRRVPRAGTHHARRSRFLGQTQIDHAGVSVSRPLLLFRWKKPKAVCDRRPAEASPPSPISLTYRVFTPAICFSLSPQCPLRSWRPAWPTWSARSRGSRTTSSTSPRRTTSKISLWRRCRYPFFFLPPAFVCYLRPVRGLVELLPGKTIAGCFYVPFGWRLFVFLPGRSKCFESLVVIGGAQGNSGNESGYLAARCWSDLPPQPLPGFPAGNGACGYFYSELSPREL